MRNTPSPQQMAEMFRRMVEVRLIEEELGRLHKDGHTRGPIHRCDGQEATGIGATAALQPDDVVTSTHRGHAHYVGKGVPLGPMIAEIFGRASGTCGGRAGHMLVADAERGLLGGCGIVGGALPVAVGQALALQMQPGGRIALCFFGDGAAQIGGVHEALNLAGLWRLPVVFVCEHNHYGLTVHASAQSSVPDLVVRAPGYGMPGATVDGNDVLAVHAAVADAVDRARRGDGPTLIEAKTYRMTGFSTSDLGGYQAEADLAAWRARDPIVRLRAVLVDRQGEATVATLENEAAAAVREAFAFALASPHPDAADLHAPEYVA